MPVEFMNITYVDTSDPMIVDVHAHWLIDEHAFSITFTAMDGTSHILDNPTPCADGWTDNLRVLTIPRTAAPVYWVAFRTNNCPPPSVTVDPTTLTMGDPIGNGSQPIAPADGDVTPEYCAALALHMVEDPLSPACQAAIDRLNAAWSTAEGFCASLHSYALAVADMTTAATVLLAVASVLVGLSALPFVGPVFAGIGFVLMIIAILLFMALIAVEIAQGVDQGNFDAAVGGWRDALTAVMRICCPQHVSPLDHTSAPTC